METSTHVTTDEEAEDSDPGRKFHILPDLVSQGGHFPSVSTLRRARHTGWFKQVQRRPEHKHARCPTCMLLQQRCVNGWRDRVDVDVYKAELYWHNQETRKWRDMEIDLHAQSRFDAGRLIVISYDDTSSLDLPKFTNRPPKHFPQSSVSFVPFNITNHGAYENNYIYTLKHAIPKGGNRICTFLYHYLHRIKFQDVVSGSVQERQKHARRLVLMADNFTENKCNTLFAFLSHLIHLNWFDEVELLFGPVGHTHNGNDSCHNCHNNMCGQFSSVTLGEFFETFVFAWTNPDARPQPIIMESFYDWDNYYRPHMNYIGGFTKTSHSPLYVRAFKFKIGKSNFVEMTYKGSPSNPVWCNSPADIYGADGLVILKSYPTEVPNIPPNPPHKMGDGHIRHFGQKNVVDMAASADLAGSMQWLTEIVVTGLVPTRGEVPPKSCPMKARGWDVVEKVGYGNRTFNTPFIRPNNRMDFEDFFCLPSEVAAELKARQDRIKHVIFANEGLF